MSDEHDQKRIEQIKAAFAKEEAHYNKVKRVFGTPEGLEVLEWLLTDLCGYWRSSLDSERELGKFELGRYLFNQVCMADIGVIHNMLDRRRSQAEAVRIEERKRLEARKE